MGGAKTVSTGGRGRGRGGRKGREMVKGRRKGKADRVGQGSEGEGQGTVGHCTFSNVHKESRFDFVEHGTTKQVKTEGFPS